MITQFDKGHNSKCNIKIRDYNLDLKKDSIFTNHLSMSDGQQMKLYNLV